MTDAQRKCIGAALAELVESARSGGPRVRIGLMASGSELGPEECLKGAVAAMDADPRIQVVCIGPVPKDVDVDRRLELVPTEPGEDAVAAAMEKALGDGTVAGAVALHYPFPVGVTTIGRIVTPACGRPMLMASSTGTASTNRSEAMALNAIYGISLAQALGMPEPSVGILNVDNAATVQRALAKLIEKGFPMRFGRSARADGGALLRGNDLLKASVDVCVCDTLTGNVLMKVFSAFTTGGLFESQGWGYGPSVGADWDKVISIVSRASGAPVIANALQLNAAAVRGRLPEAVKRNMALAAKCGLKEILDGLAPKAAEPQGTAVPAPPREPVDDEIHGIDVLDLEAAVQELWKAGIYAESAMGCTGPVVKLAASNRPRATEILRSANYC